MVIKVINPNAIDVCELPFLPMERNDCFPSVSAIYFAVDSSGFVQYIGRAGDLRSRWKQHHKRDVLTGFRNIKIAWLEVSDPSSLPLIEEILIKHFHPPLNASRHGGGMIQIRWSDFEGLRKRAGLTQQDVANFLGLKSDQTVSDWENGMRVPRLTPEQTFLLCQKFDCTLEDLKNAFPKKLTA